MKTHSKVLLAAFLLAAAPAAAGNLNFNDNQAAWTPTKCPKPMPPPSLTGLNPETSGNDMNALSHQYNAYADAAQAYMNCVSSEAQHDQSVIDQAIVAGAQEEIAATAAQTQRFSATLRRARD